MNQDSFGTAPRSSPARDSLSGDAYKEKPKVSGDHSEGKASGAFDSSKTGAMKDRDSGPMDFSDLRDDIAKLRSTVTDLVQRQTAGARAQVTGAVGAAGDSISQSASAAQDQLMSLERDVGSSIKSNPWSAVAIAALVGLLIGKMS